jgi:1,4-alpha-glucan branching enzyme
MPYVLDHGESPNGADWLYEAAAETYVPLLDTCHRLIDEGISPQITLGLTPILCEQLADHRFRHRFPRYLARIRDQAAVDAQTFTALGDHALANVAQNWVHRYDKLITTFRSSYGGDLIAAFRQLQEAGYIEIIASSATHGYSPLLLDDDSVRRQVSVGVGAHERHFGRRPRGYWLPECAYRPAGAWVPPQTGATEWGSARERLGVDDVLAENGIVYFFAETRGYETPYMSSFGSRLDAIAAMGEPKAATDANPSPYSAHMVASRTGTSGCVQVFFRDPATGLQVWSGESGYPSSEWYLDFHKRQPGDGSMGLRYWRVTGRDGEKEPYDHCAAERQTRRNARHFASIVTSTLRREKPSGDGIICATYDTELFGHWWHEGADFLYHAIRELHRRGAVRRVTCGGYLATPQPASIPITLPEGSWGAGGKHAVWLNAKTEWVWELIYSAETRAQHLRKICREGDRFLMQAERELLLLEASDWPFLISTDGAADYAALRLRHHNLDFHALADIIELRARGHEPTVSNWKALAASERRDHIFTRHAKTFRAAKT